MYEMLSPKAESRILRAAMVAAGVLTLVSGDAAINVQAAREAKAAAAIETARIQALEQQRVMDKKVSLMKAARMALATSERCEITAVTDHGEKNIRVHGAPNPQRRRAIEVTIDRTQTSKGAILEATYPRDGDPSLAVSSELLPGITGQQDRYDRPTKQAMPVPNGLAPRNRDQINWDTDHESQKIQSREESAATFWVLPYADWQKGSTIRVNLLTHASNFMSISAETGESSRTTGTSVCENSLTLQSGSNGQDLSWTLKKAPGSSPVIVNR